MVENQKPFANMSNGANTQKRGKGKKAPESVDTSKLLEQRIAQLEQNRAGDREQELEIGKWPSSGQAAAINYMIGLKLTRS